MTRRRTLLGRAVVAALLLGTWAALGLATDARAQEAISPQNLDDIRYQVRANRAAMEREAALAQGLGNPQLAATLAEKSRRRADTALAATVVSIIAANRAAAPQVLAVALAEAPDSRQAILHAVESAFPTLAASGVRPPSQAAPLAPAPLGMPPPARGGGLRFQEDPNDPIEPFNRAVFAFNDAVDTLFLRPVAAIYGFLLPTVAKISVRNFFDNLNSPVILANDLLQLTFDDALVTTGRFLVNSTIGVAGLFDVAMNFGLEPHGADFGQTLHSYGVGQGFYLMVPVLGPSTLRNGTGRLVDGLFQPLNYLLEFPINLGVTLADGISLREGVIGALDDLRFNSIDYYAALRGAYYQNRARELRKGRDSSADTIDQLFEEFE